MGLSGPDLYLELESKINLLNKAVNVLSERGCTFAKAQHDYRVELAKQILTEREKKIPVTIISDLCRGNIRIAKLRFERDVAEVTYKSALEAINSYKLQIRVLEGQISREWGHNDNI